MKPIATGTGLSSWREALPFSQRYGAPYHLLAAQTGGRKAPTSVKLCHPTLVSRGMPKPPFLS